VEVHDFAGLRVLPAFALLGLACGLLAIVIARGLFTVEHLYRRLPVSEFWHPAIGAVGFVTVGLFMPRVLGVGYDVIGDVLDERVTVKIAAEIAGAKLLAWWLALGSGTSGGTLAPILMISASFGTVIGAGMNHVMPGEPIALGAFAVVAMAATFGASTRATFTSIVFVFELTRDYQVILPLMLATVIADLVYSAVNDDSLMTEKLRRRGLHIGRHYGVDPFTTTPVSAIMSPKVEVLDATATVHDARQRFRTHTHSAYPIVDTDGKLVGIVTRGDLLEAEWSPEAPLLELASTDVVTVHPSATATAVLRVMLDERVEHVPVIADGILVGICTRSDLLDVRRAELALDQHADDAGAARFAALMNRYRRNTITPGRSKGVPPAG
jgi:CBS domain-containing protein